jgi:hypothetical protein
VTFLIVGALKAHFRGGNANKAKGFFCFDLRVLSPIHIQLLA